MKLIFIAGPWGSGTTAVTGALSSLGVATLGPHFQSSDPRTRNTYELIPFRNLVLEYVDEHTARHKDNYSSGFVPALEQFRTRLENTFRHGLAGKADTVIALKMPLASICLPEICSTFDTRIIVVHRPMKAIEASRSRRKWPPLYGSAGAQHIYSMIFNDVIEHKLSFIGISYRDFVHDTTRSLMNIIDYCEIHDLRNNLESAIGFVKTPKA